MEQPRCQWRWLVLAFCEPVVSRELPRPPEYTLSTVMVSVGFQRGCCVRALPQPPEYCGCPGTIAIGQNRSRDRSRLSLGDYFCCCSGTIAICPERLETTAAPPALVREQPEFVRADREPDTRWLWEAPGRRGRLGRPLQA